MKLVRIHRLLLLGVFTFSSFLAVSQQERVVLTNGETFFSMDNCLSPNEEYKDLQIKVNPRNMAVVKNASVTLSLDDGTQKKFPSISDFDSFDLKGWLLDSSAFTESSQVKFEVFLIYEVGSPEQYSFGVCLVEEGVDKLPPREKGYTVVPVFFASDRNYNKNLDLDERFGVERGSLKYGYCNVSIPKIHEVGQIESPSLWRFELSEDPKKHIVVQSINISQKESFFKQLSNKVKRAGSKSTFLFVHGYNVSFMDAAKRTAQMAYDLEFDGVPVFYSWPSKASTSAYTMDEATIQWSKLNMENFLRDYLKKSEAEEIYLIAHSMGNRGLTRALLSVVSEQPDLNDKISEIILAAPDIDADVFKRDIAPRMVQRIKKPITLYVSSGDVALKASKAVHGSPRAGDSAEVLTLVDGVETIDASGTDTSFLGHSYFVETRTVMNDLFDLINNAKRPSSRPNLLKQQKGGKVFWKIRQTND